MQELLESFDIDKNTREIFYMPTEEFMRYRNQDRFTKEQRMLLSIIRDRCKPFFPALSSSLVQKRNTNRGYIWKDKQLPMISSPSSSQDIVDTKGMTISQMQDLLTNAGIQENISIIIALDKDDFLSFRNSDRFSEDQRKLLSSVRYRSRALIFFIKIKPKFLVKNRKNQDIKPPSEKRPKKQARLVKIDLEQEPPKISDIEEPALNNLSPSNSRSDHDILPLNLTHEQMNELLHNAGIEETVVFIFSLGTQDFLIFKHSEKFNETQRKLISSVRSRCKKDREK